MSTMTFDTHKFVKQLEAAGVPRMQAEACVVAQHGKSGEESCASRTTTHLSSAVRNRAKLAAEMPSLHGSKRETAALTATPQHIAPTPRRGYAAPGCIRPQPALDPATGRRFGAARKHFSGLEKALCQNSALFRRH